MEKPRYAYFDTNGQELPWGRYHYCSPFQSGWSETVTYLSEPQYIDGMILREKERKLINEQGESPYGKLPDDLHMTWTRDLRVFSDDKGVWDYKDGRMILPIRKTDKFYSANFNVNEGEWLHAEIDGEFRRYNRDGALDRVLTSVKAWRYPMLLALPADETQDSFIEVDEEPEHGFYFMDEPFPHRIRSGVDGSVSRDFLRIGPQVEGLRYVQELDGTDHFLNAAYEPVLKLPYPVNMVDNMCSMHVESWYCRDGRITMNAWKGKGRKISYMMDRNGEIVIPPGKFVDMIHVGCGRMLVSKANKMALADLDGNLLTDFVYSCQGSLGFFERSRCFIHGLLPMVKKVGRRHTMCALNPQGEEVFPPIFESLELHGSYLIAEGFRDKEISPIVLAEYL